MARVVIIKGGAGSGNWGHLGRPGLVGGSMRGAGRGIGGLRTIGATRQTSVSERHAASAETKTIRQLMAKRLHEIAGDLGIDESMVVYGGKGYEFNVGNDHYQAAGHYDPSLFDGKGGVVVFEPGLYKGQYKSGERYANASKSLLAHEFMHHKFHAYLNRATSDYAAIDIEFRKRDAAGVPDRENIIRYDGEFRNPSDAKKYPGYALSQWIHTSADDEWRNSSLKSDKGQQYSNRYERLVAKDGVSEYSKSYWKPQSGDQMIQAAC